MSRITYVFSSLNLLLLKDNREVFQLENNSFIKYVIS